MTTKKGSTTQINQDWVTGTKQNLFLEIAYLKPELHRANNIEPKYVGSWFSILSTVIASEMVLPGVWITFSPIFSANSLSLALA